MCRGFSYSTLSCNFPHRRPSSFGSHVELPGHYHQCLLHPAALRFLHDHRSRFQEVQILQNPFLIVFFAGPLVILNFRWKLHLVFTTPWFRRWNSNTRNGRTSENAVFVYQTLTWAHSTTINWKLYIDVLSWRSIRRSVLYIPTAFYCQRQVFEYNVFVKICCFSNNAVSCEFFFSKPCLDYLRSKWISHLMDTLYTEPWTSIITKHFNVSLLV